MNKKRKKEHHLKKSCCAYQTIIPRMQLKTQLALVSTQQTFEHGCNCHFFIQLLAIYKFQNQNQQSPINYTRITRSKTKNSIINSLFGNLKLLDFVQQDFGLAGRKVQSHGLQYPVECLGDGGFEIPGVHLSSQIVSLQHCVIRVLDRALKRNKRTTINNKNLSDKY
jgi:hypothetical protein